MANVDISDLEKSEVLAALYNESSRRVSGKSDGPEVMTVEDAANYIAGKVTGHIELYFDHLYGRPLKVGIGGSSFDPWRYDQNNGGDGTAQRVIDELRKAKAGNQPQAE